jgi:hypothetical protein
MAPASPKMDAAAGGPGKYGWRAAEGKGKLPVAPIAAKAGRRIADQPRFCIRDGGRW